MNSRYRCLVLTGLLAVQILADWSDKAFCEEPEASLLAIPLPSDGVPLREPSFPLHGQTLPSLPDARPRESLLERKPPVKRVLPSPVQRLLDAASRPVKLDSEQCKTRLVAEAAELKSLTEQLRDVLRGLETELGRSVGDGTSPLRQRLQLAEELLRTEVSLCDSYSARLAVHSEYLTTAKWIERQAAELWEAKNRQISAAELMRIKAMRLRAEIALYRERTSGVTPEEFGVLLQRAEYFSAALDMVRTRLEVGAAGGRYEDLCRAGYQVCRAKADLALAAGNRKRAVIELFNSRSFARQLADATKSKYQAGMATINEVQEAELAHSEAHLLCVRTEKPAREEYIERPRLSANFLQSSRAASPE